jgi:hypothetical protein
MDVDIICCMPKQTVFRGDRKDVLAWLGNLHNGDSVFGRSVQLGGFLVEVTLLNRLSHE